MSQMYVRKSQISAPRQYTMLDLLSLVPIMYTM